MILTTNQIQAIQDSVDHAEEMQRKVSKGKPAHIITRSEETRANYWAGKKEGLKSVLEILNI